MTVGVQKLRGAPTNCFIAGTLVAVAGAGVGVGTGTADAGPSSASKPIEEIQVGDFVWARDEHDPSAPAKLEKVVALYRSTSYDLQQLEVVNALGQSEQIVATDGHPFYVVDVGWTTADAVQVGQKLVGAGGAVLTVVANRDWKPDGGVVVYNFQVEGDHTYFVGDIHAQGKWVWTHNACAAGGLDGPSAKSVHDKYVNQVRPGARERAFDTPWSKNKGLGSRKYDDFDDVTKTGFEGNTTPWSRMTQEQLSRKLDQVGADFALLQQKSGPVRRIVWFGTEALPTKGLGGQLRAALSKAGIPYWVVNP